MSRAKILVRKLWFDVLIAALAIEGMLELVVGRDSPNAPRTLWFAVPAIGALVLPLFARRRFPFAATAAYWLLAAGIAVVDWRVIPAAVSLFAVGLTVSFLLGHLRNALQGGLGLGIVLACAVVVVFEIRGHSTAELVFIPLEFGIAWVAGFALRERSVRAEEAELRALMAERERDAAARIAVAEERARIARELHDIVAHAVSVMVLQVGAVRHRHARALGEDSEALEGVEQAGRTALAEMRRLLAAMRSDGDDVELGPQPGLDALDSLVREVGRAGLPVHLRVDGQPVPLPRAIDLSAYRILQEGLTNVLKHAHARNADVTLRYAADEFRIEIHDDGRGSSSTDGLGHGLTGIRERVKIYGGEMSAGPADNGGGGFVLKTRLPFTAEPR